ncbi:AAA family ATPase [Paenibacillus chondroitinus]|uniref:AAA family ATPase n=1 Tax=Paenibacillus chondroitinus TaxID=59842 RepID=A0ABU6DAL7_9BACL|nr:MULTISPECIES: AAA family ATPase [Paenibacillus]MCY9659850.1 ATP-binding protein [Paenibacillus anseongense]MEB4793971.1 AAA family ATPase [Paenibacillus chondroitinus]
MSSIILFRGKAGTGKTTLSNELGKRLKTAVLHKDDIYDAVAKDVFAHEARNQICFDFLYRFLQTVIATEADVILDYGFNHSDDVLKFKHWVEERGGKLRTLHCICSDESTWAQRLAERSKAPKANQLITDLDKLKEHYKHVRLEFLEGELVLDTVLPIDLLMDQVFKSL